MTKKAKTDAERREALEFRLAENRAKEIADRSKREAQAHQKAKNVYDNIWAQFAADRKKSRSFAYSQLLENLTQCASYLVPILMTAKEHVSLITDIESRTKGDEQSQQEDPRVLMSSWLATGQPDLCRIPLTKTVVQ